MSSILAQLEEEGARASAWNAAVATAIDVVRTLEARDSGYRPASATLPRQAKQKRLPAPKVRTGGRQPNATDPEKVEQARAIAITEGLSKAAKATGIKYNTLYGIAQRDGWVYKGKHKNRIPKKSHRRKVNRATLESVQA